MRCVCFRVKHGTVFCYTRADHDLGPYVSERLSHHSHHSHQHPRSEDHNHLSFDTPHLSSVIKTPVISTLLPISHCPVYRSHPGTKPDLSILTCVFPYPRHFGFSCRSCSPALPGFLQEITVTVTASKASGSGHPVLHSHLLVIPLLLAINTLFLFTYFSRICFTTYLCVF